MSNSTDPGISAEQLPDDAREYLRAKMFTALNHPTCRVPQSLHEGLVRYVCDGIQTGSFLAAVLSNDLKEASARADYTSRYRLFDIVSFLYDVAPVACWGSPQKVAAWTKRTRPEATPAPSNSEPAPSQT